jgi:hypothetical protein
MEEVEPALGTPESVRQAPRLHIEVLGRFRWSIDDRALPEPSRVGIAALSYLLVHAGESIRHEEMEALFTLMTPHPSDEWAVEVERLRHLLPPALLRITAHSIRMSRQVTSDLAEINALLEPPHSTPALQRAWLLLRSEFLEDFELDNRPIWEVWLRARRTRMRKHLKFVTEQLGLSVVDPAAVAMGSTGTRWIH